MLTAAEGFNEESMIMRNGAIGRFYTIGNLFAHAPLLEAVNLSLLLLIICTLYGIVVFFISTWIFIFRAGGWFSFHRIMSVNSCFNNFGANFLL